MSVLIYLLKTMAIQGGAYLGYRLLLDREPWGHLKRVYLLGGLLVSFLIPLLPAGLPWPALEGLERLPLVLPEVTVFTPESTVTETANSLPLTGWQLLLAVVYLTGLVSGLYRLFQFLADVRKRVSDATSIDRDTASSGGAAKTIIPQKGKSTPSDRLGHVSVSERLSLSPYLVALPYATEPHTFWRWVFYDGREPPAPEILAHESAHARQLHSLDRLLVALLRAVCWFNPVLYWYDLAIRENHELLADRAVLRAGWDRTTYQQRLLLALQSINRVPHLSSGAGFTLTKKRFQMMYTSSGHWSRTLAKLSGVGLLWAVLLLGFGRTGYTQTAPTVTGTNEQGQMVQQPVPTAKQLATWRANRDNTFHVDSKLVSATTLQEYAPGDFSQYYVIKAPEGSGDRGLNVYLFTEKNYPWPNVPPPPPPTIAPPPPPVPAMAPPAPPVNAAAPPPPPTVAPPAPPSGANLPPPPPPPMDWNAIPDKVPSAEQLKTWQDAKEFGIWIDRKRVANQDLTQYSPEDFGLYQVSRLMKNAVNYGKYKYQVNLVTKERLARYRKQGRQ